MSVIQLSLFGNFTSCKCKSSANGLVQILTLVLLNPDIPCLCKQCRSRSVGFWRSQLIWIYTVCHSVCEFIATIQIKSSDWLKIRSGRGILIYSAGQGLMLSLLGKNCSRWHFEIFYYFFSKVGFGISCKLSIKETICMKCQSLFPGKNKKKKWSFCRLLT